MRKQECIAVGSVPNACWPYLTACTARGGSTCSRGVYLVPGGCTWSGGVYLVLGHVPGPREVYLIPEGCTWFWGCTWSQGVYLVPGGVPGSGGCTWSQEVYLVPGGYLVLVGYTWLVLGGCTWSRGDVPGLVGGTCPGTFPPPCEKNDRQV